MDELEALRARKLAELQARRQMADNQEFEQRAQMNAALTQIDLIVRRFLSKEAQDRLDNLRLVQPELVQKLKLYLAQMYSSGQIKQMDDAQLKEILVRLSGSKHETTIKRI